MHNLKEELFQEDSIHYLALNSDFSIAEGIQIVAPIIEAIRINRETVREKLLNIYGNDKKTLKIIKA